MRVVPISLSLAAILSGAPTASADVLKGSVGGNLRRLEATLVKGQAFQCMRPDHGINCQFLGRLVDEDGESAFLSLLEAPRKICSSHLNHVRAITPEELWGRLRAQAETEIGALPLPYPGCGDGLAPEQEVARTAKYWFSLRRLGLGQKELMREVVAIDRLLGETSSPCQGPSLTAIAELCAASTCTDGTVGPGSGERDLEALATATAEALKKLAAINDVRARTYALRGPGERVDSLDAAKAALTEGFPWLAQGDFRAKAANSSSVKEALRSALKERRDLQLGLYRELDQAVRCLATAEEECKAHDVRAALEKAPFPQETSIRAKNESEIVAGQIRGYEACVQDMKSAQVATAETLWRTAVDGALVALTLPAGMAATSTRALGLANGAKVAAQLGFGVQASRSVIDAQKACREENIRRVEYDAKVPASVGKRPQSACPDSRDVAGLNSRAEIGDCVSNILFAAAELGGGALSATRELSRARRPVVGEPSLGTSAKMRGGPPRRSIFSSANDVAPGANPQLKIWQLREAGRANEAARLEAAMMKKLETSPMKPLGSASGESINKAELVELEDGLKGIWKPSRAINGASTADLERTAFDVDRELGFDRTPLVIEREFGGTKGTLHLFVSDLDQATFIDDAPGFMFYDELIANRDRGRQNVGSVEGRAVGWDHEYAFDTDYQPFSAEARWLSEDLSTTTPRSKKIVNTAAIKATMPTRSQFEKLKATDEARWRELLGRLDERRIEGFLKRRARLIERVEELLKKHGDEIFADGPYSPAMRRPAR